MSELTTFHLIRHAECDINLRPHIIYGRSNDSPLSPIGVDQSNKLRRRFEEEKPEFDHTYVSPSLRTFDTFKIALPKCPLSKFSLDYQIQELDQGSWTGVERKLAYASPEAEGKDEDHWNFKAPRGESQDLVAKRGEDRLVQIALIKTGNYALFTHGGFIKYFCTDRFGWDKNVAWKVAVDNTSITTLTYDKERNSWNLVKFNDCSHLTRY